MSVGVVSLYASPPSPLGCAGKTHSKPSGHGEGVTRPGRTHKRPKDLSACGREERGRGERGGVYAVSMCERVT